MSKLIKLKNEELVKFIGETNHFPKYTTQIINLANQNAQGTRPKVVGQLTDLIQEAPHKTYTEWKEWYLKKYPNTIDKATEKVIEMIDNLKEAISKIDNKMVREWVEDLVLVKTFVGLCFQEAIFNKISLIKNKSYRLAKPEEESKGIDGFIDKTSISIKPMTYKTKPNLKEKIDAKIIYYEKKKDGIILDISEID